MEPPPPAGSDAEPKKKLSKKVLLLLVLIGACVLSVPCIGILSAIAIPSFIRYTRQAKVTEASANVASLEAAVRSYCAEFGRLPDAAGPLPSVPSSTPQAGDFASDPVFREIGFSPMDPVYYSYALEPAAGGALVIVAEGDLDGDGVRSRFAVTCSADCSCGEMTRTNEYE